MRSSDPSLISQPTLVIPGMQKNTPTFQATGCAVKDKLMQQGKEETQMFPKLHSSM